MATTYQYKPLTGHETRLLHLSPRSAGAELRGRLTVANLDKSSYYYEAVSYEWRSSQRTRTILIQPENQQVAITENLARCLEDVRYTRGDKLRVLWVDAICINHDDPVENEHQVAVMMMAIFRRPAQVITYLGRSDESVGDVRVDGNSGGQDDHSSQVDAESVRLAQDMVDYVTDHKRRIREQMPLDYRHKWEHVPDMLRKRDPKDPRWAALRSLMMRGWVSLFSDLVIFVFFLSIPGRLNLLPFEHFLLSGPGYFSLFTCRKTLLWLIFVFC